MEFIGPILTRIFPSRSAFNTIYGDKMVLKKFIIFNKDKERLTGIFHQVNDKKDLVIVCHGFNEDKDKDLVTGFCKALNREDFNAFRFDFSGNGESEGSFENSCFTKEADDLNSVINFFAKKNYHIKSVVGYSTSGTVAILQVARDERIKSIIVVAPRIYPSKSTMAKKIEKKYNKTLSEIIKDPKIKYPITTQFRKGKRSFSRQYVEEIAILDVLVYLKQIKAPILMLHGNKDQIINIGETKDAFQAGNKPKTFVEIDEADHTFSNPVQMEEMIYKALHWLKNQGDNTYQPSGEGDK